MTLRKMVELHSVPWSKYRQATESGESQPAPRGKKARACNEVGFIFKSLSRTFACRISRMSLSKERSLSGFSRSSEALRRNRKLQQRQAAKEPTYTSRSTFAISAYRNGIRARAFSVVSIDSEVNNSCKISVLKDSVWFH